MGREPVVIGAIVRLLLVALAGYVGVEFTEAETEEVVAVVGALYGLLEITVTAYQRSKVTPVANPNLPNAVVIPETAQDVPPPRVDSTLPPSEIN